MKKNLLIFCLMTGFTFTNAQTLTQKLYFDFGANDVTNGTQTTGADANSNNWNNISSTPAIAPGVSGSATSIIAAQNFPNLITSSGTPTSYGLYFNSTFTVNGITKGGLVTPYTSQFVGNEDFAIASATQDYIFTTVATSGPSFKLTGLTTTKRYKFKIFGSRNTSGTRTSQYTIQGLGSSVSGTLPTSTVAGLGGNVYYKTSGNTLPDIAYYSTTPGGIYNASSAAYYGNNSSVYTSDYFYPTAGGEISIALTQTAGSFGYINCMKMEEYKGTQTITFAATASKSMGDATYTPNAVASSSLPVLYSSDNESVAAIVDSQIKIVGVGTANIKASQAGNDIYEAASDVFQTLTVGSVALLSQTITFDALTAKIYGDATFDLNSSASSSLPVSYKSSNEAVATVTGKTVTIVGVGTSDITASQVGNGTYNAATDMLRTLTVNKASQVITYTSLTSKTNADGVFTLSGSVNSPLPLNYTSSNMNVATISGNTVYIIGVGTTNITASQAGNTNYNAATDVVQSFIVTSSLIKQQSLFFDFGPKDIINGDETVGQDANGNYWNNISTATGSSAMPLNTTFKDFVNSANNPSSFQLTFTTAGFTTNGKANGGLLTPHVSQFGDNSEFAIASATEDYMYTGSTANGPTFVISGLNSTRRYKFKVFGCRNQNSDRAGQYTVQGAGSAYVFGMSSSSAIGLGGTVYIGQNVSYPGNLNVLYALTPTDTLTKAVTYYGNNSTVYNTPYIYPDASGNISINTITTTPLSAFAYINALKMEEYSEVPTTIDNSASKLLHVSPTNFANYISVSGAESSIEMFNAAGVKMLSQPAKSTTILNTNILAKGFYILVVDNKTSFKVVKR